MQLAILQLELQLTALLHRQGLISIYLTHGYISTCYSSLEDPQGVLEPQTMTSKGPALCFWITCYFPL